jgi:hypothetical protein
LTVSYLGALTLGQCVPLALAAGAQIDAAVAFSLPDIQAKLTGALFVQAQLAISPPSLAASLSATQQMVANLQLMINLPTPPIVPDFTAMLAVIAELGAQLAAISAQVAFVASFAAILGTPGVFAYKYEGAVGSMGNQLQAVLGGGLPGGTGPGQPVYSLVFVATDAGAIAAMQTLLVS